MNKLDNNYKHVYRTENGNHHQPTRMNNGHSGRSNGSNFFSNLPANHGGVDVTVDVKVSVKKDDKSSMTHDEAMRLCNLMGNNASSANNDIGGDREVPLGDTLLQELPSFDYGDHHSLSSEGDVDSRREISINGLLHQAEYQEDNILELVRGDLQPLELGGEEPFDDFCNMSY